MTVEITEIELLHGWQHTDEVAVFTGVLRRSCAFLHDPDGFFSWFEGLEILRKQYFRCLVLLQIHKLDGWFADKSEVACYVTTLFNTTAVLLDLESAVSEGKFARSKTNPPGDSNTSTQVRHTLEGAMKILGYFSEIEAHDSADTNTGLHSDNPRVWEIAKKHRGDIAILLGDSALPVRGIVEMVPRLGVVVDGVFRRHTRDAGRGNSEAGASDEQHGDDEDQSPSGAISSAPGEQGVPAQKVPPHIAKHDDDEGRDDGSEGEHKGKEKAEGPRAGGEEAGATDANTGLGLTRGEICEDVIIWRVLLLGMLFWTAPDSSELLKSGVLDHVVPVI